MRGDLEVNEVKLKNALHCNGIALGQLTPKCAAAGLGRRLRLPHRHYQPATDCRPESITTGGNNFVVGANRPDTHYRNANYPRDFRRRFDLLTDIALAPSPASFAPSCGAEL